MGLKEEHDRQFGYVSVTTTDKIFADEVVKHRFLDRMERDLEKQKTKVAAFSLLDDRLDMLLIGPKTEKKGRAVREEGAALVEKLARESYYAYAQKYGRKGNLVKEPSAAYRRITSPAQALNCTTKIHMLAVEAGIVEHMRDYWWCSFQFYKGNRAWGFMDVDEILGLFPGDERQAGMRFIRYQMQQFKAGRAARKKVKNKQEKKLKVSEGLDEAVTKGKDDDTMAPF